MSGSSVFVDVEVPLALGLEPVDAIRQARVPPPLLALCETATTPEELDRLRRDGELRTLALPALRRSASCRFLLLYKEMVYDSARPWIDLRLVEGRGLYGPRRFVPRRLRIPLVAPSLADLDHARLVRRPGLFPGAEYPIHDTATTLRGRVERNGAPMRWARVEAYLPLPGGAIPPATSTAVIAVAHGDDRGEFLLVVPSQVTAGAATLAATVCVRAWGPATAPQPPSPAVERVDPHWDLPIEELGFGPAGASMTAGLQRPAHYTQSTARRVTLPLGRATSDRVPYQIP